ATNCLYAAPGSRSLFKNKKVDYDKISNQSQDILQKKQSVLKGEDIKEVQSQERASKKILQSNLSDISQIHIPQELGRVVEVYQGSAGNVEDTAPLIVGIQDLHTNPEAELNLAKILELLLKDYNMGLVCSEGAVGKVDTSSVSSFPDYSVREKVSRVFIDSGELTGEEYLSITKYPDLPIWGIETKDIYFNNIIDFNKIMKFNPSSQVFISQTKKAITELKPKVYSKDLLDLDQKESEFSSQKLDTAKYIQYLTGFTKKLNISMVDYKNISILTETMEKEKTIDQLKIMNQSQNLLLNLQSTLQNKSLNNDLDGLIARSSLFKDQKISPFSFYSYLKDLALKHIRPGLDGSDESALSSRPGLEQKYPELMNFIDYLTKVNSLDSTKLFTELEDLNFEIKESLSKTDEQKNLVKIDHNINFLESFFNLKVSNEDLDYYLNNKDFHKVAFFKDFLPKTLKRYNINTFIDYNPDLIDNHLQDLEDFYKVVKERDIAMVTNAISEITKRNVKLATLIHGGFHTKGITKLLREKGYSYIIVSPYSKTDIDEENYHFLLSGRRKPIEELLQQLDLSKIIDNLLNYQKTLRVPLAFSGLEQEFNAKVAPSLAKIWAVGVAEVTLENIIQRIRTELAVAAARNKALLAKLENLTGIEAAASTEPGAVIVKLTPQKGYSTYFKLTRDKVTKVKAGDFKAGMAKTVAESPKSEELAISQAIRSGSEDLPASAKITALTHEVFADPEILTNLTKDTLAAVALQYGLTRGYPRLIELLSALLKRENIDAHPDAEVVILDSISEAEDTLARLLIEEGDVVIFQKGSLSKQDKGIYKFYGAKFAELNLSNIKDVEKLDKLLETGLIRSSSVKFIQVLSETKDGKQAISDDARIKLLELAERYGLLLVEDGRYREPVLSKSGSLKSMDKKGLNSRVVQLRSLSPLFGKDVDIGSIYVVLPSALAIKFEATKGSVTLHPNSMAQVFVYKELLRRYDPQKLEFRQLTKEEKEPELPKWLASALSDYGKKVKLSEIRRILKLMADPKLISLAGGIPAIELFPYQETDDLISEFGEGEWREALTRSPSQGIERLRKIIAKNHYSRPEDVIITDGSQEGLDLLGYLVKTISARSRMTDRSMEIITQRPTYLGLMSAVDPYGCEVKPYDLNSLEGLEKLRSDLIDRKNSGKALPSLIYAMSTFDNPGGRVMSLEVRKRLIEIAIEFGIFIAEDNPYGALRYEGDEIPTLLELSKDLDEDIVIYLGTVSKTFTPGMRIGWTIAPEKIIDILKTHEEMTRGGANSLTQVLTARFIETGLIDAHVKNVLIAEYSKRRAAMIAALEKYMPKGATWTEGPGGYFIFLTLPEEVNAEELLVEMTRKERNGKNVGFVPGWAFLGGQNELRLSFPTNKPEIIDTAIHALAIAIEDKLQSGTLAATYSYLNNRLQAMGVSVDQNGLLTYSDDAQLKGLDRDYEQAGKRTVGDLQKKGVIGKLAQKSAEFLAIQKTVLYNMIHGLVPTPRQKISKTPEGSSKGWSTLNFTAFSSELKKFPDGEIVKTTGHFNPQLDIQQVGQGEFISLQIKYDSAGNPVENRAQYLKPGDIFYALPGYFHVTIPVGEGTHSFFDIGYADGTYKDAIYDWPNNTPAPYLFVNRGGKITMVLNPDYKGKEIPPIQWYNADKLPKAEGQINLVDLYAKASEPGMAKILDAIEKGELPAGVVMQRPTNVVEEVRMNSSETTLRKQLTYEPNPLGFGTSGLRAKIKDMTDLEITINTQGFLRFLEKRSDIKRDDTIVIGGDLRSSTDKITQAVIHAIKEAGYSVEYLGHVPTPLLSYYAFTRGLAHVMVTGSHIPDDRNGIKFVKTREELMKEDEKDVLSAVTEVREKIYSELASESPFDENGALKLRQIAPDRLVLPVVNDRAVEEYLQRYVRIFPGKPLKGKRIVVYEQSTVGRDLLVNILKQLGAEVIREGRSAAFIPIDTENITPENLVYFRELAEKHKPDAIISGDGDFDRPLVIDAQGRFYRGDVLGLVVAKALSVDFVAVPISANDIVRSELERAGIEIKQTKIGSPYVARAMQKAEAQGRKRVCSWEVNGGFLLQTPIIVNGERLEPLPTRDALLPILTVLTQAAGRNVPVEQLFNELPNRFTQAGLLDNFPREASQQIIAKFSPSGKTGIVEVEFTGDQIQVVRGDGTVETPDAGTAGTFQHMRQELEKFFTPENGFDRVLRINWIDGVKIMFLNGDVVHIRPSGNAPQLRIYAQTNASQSRADNIVFIGIKEPDGILRQMEQAVMESIDSKHMAAQKAFKDNPVLLKIHCSVQHYDWGERGNTAFIPALLRIDNSDGKPYAELWIGAHPSLPAKADVMEIAINLNDLINGASEEILGKDIATQFNKQLPYLLKVLAAGKMLSIQAHPNKKQAEAGFKDEDARGIPIKAFNRDYKDANHKPELIVAVKDFYALNGFRPLEEIAGFLEDIEEFHDIMPDFRQRLNAAGQDETKRKELIKELYSKIMSEEIMPQEKVDEILKSLIERLKEQSFDKDNREFWILKADEQYTKDGHIDRGIFSIYLLNFIHLRSGEAMYLGAGGLHAYLEGVGMECMANSDNVLRGGLTPKYVDVSELLKVLTFNSGKPEILKARQVSPSEILYDTPAREFALSVINVTPGNPHKNSDVHSADALIVLEGNVEVKAKGKTLSLKKGDTVIIPAILGEYEITGQGKLYKASVPLEAATIAEKLESSHAAASNL
nr:mannose-6-phosphate isomerase, class I [Candidatus Omnitrophota bacterium]